MYDKLVLAAYQEIARAFHCSADDILVTPELRRQFVEAIISQRSGLTEKFILQRLIYLRKKGVGFRAQHRTRLRTHRRRARSRRIATFVPFQSACDPYRFRIS